MTSTDWHGRRNIGTVGAIFALRTGIFLPPEDLTARYNVANESEPGLVVNNAMHYQQGCFEVLESSRDLD